MDAARRNMLGQGFLGLLIGLFLLPFVYIAVVRGEVAQAKTPMWGTIYVLIVAVPALLGLLFGRARSSS